MAISTICRCARLRRDERRAGLEIHPEIGEQRRRQAREFPAVDDSGQPCRRDAEENVLGDRQLGNEIELLVDHADAELERVARAGDLHRLIANADLAAVLPIGAAENLHQRRLPGAVLAEQHVHFAAAEREIDAGQSDDTRKRFPDAAHLEDRLIDYHGSPITRYRVH